MNWVELDKEFRKQGEINAQKLLQITDITGNVKKLEGEINLMIPDIERILGNDNEPMPCECIYKSRSNHCPAFKYLHPDAPDYSVHDIVRIGLSKKRLETLVEDNCYAIKEVPKDFKLTKYQRNHVDVTQTQNPIIEPVGIAKMLNKLAYPLYFLDYETYPTAIPIYDGCAPYQQVPFQYSLRILKGSNEELEHYEYLHTDVLIHPMRALAGDLMKHIDEDGSIIVWSKKFEGKCHEDIAVLLPEYTEIFRNYNERFFDLMEICSKNLYVHHDFRGSFSIKAVLPVLVPEMSYKNLNIRDGSMAMIG